MVGSRRAAGPGAAVRSRRHLLWAALQVMVWTPLVLVMLRGLSALFDGPLPMLRLDVSDVLPAPVLVLVGFAVGDPDPVESPPSWLRRCRSSFSAWTRRLFGLGFAYLWYSAFYHGNIAWNLGPLRWIVVTPPQSHRVHHSADPARFDTNFRTFFSLWDRIFVLPAPTPRSTRRRGSVTPRCPWNTSSAWPTRLTPTWRSSHIPSAESGTTIGLSVASATTSTPTESDSPWDGPRITTRTPRSPS